MLYRKLCHWLRDTRRLGLLGLVLAGAVWVSIRTHFGSTDLGGFHEAWVTVWQSTFNQTELEDVERYPPGFLLLFAPLGGLPRWLVGLGWYAANLVCSIAVWILTCRKLHLDWQGDRILLSVLAGTLPFWMDNLVLGQNAPLLMLLVATAWWLLDRRRPVLAGGCLGLATAIKLIPAIFLLPVVLRRELRVVAGFFAGLLAVSLVLGTVFLGTEQNWAMHVDWFQEITSTEDSVAEDPTRPATMRYSLRYNNQSLEAVLARLMLPVNAGTYGEPFQVNLVAASSSTWRVLRGVLITLILLFGGIALIDVLYYSPAAAWPDTRSLAITTLMMLLLCPLVWTHYFVWAFFPLMSVAQNSRDGWSWGHVMIGVWILAMLLAPFPVMRGVGVNIWTTLGLFVLLTGPHIRRAYAGLYRLLTRRVLAADG